MKVLNLNIWNQNWYWEKRLKIIQDMLLARGFNNESVSVLAFHEVMTTPEHNQLREINKRLEFENLYEFQVKEDGDKVYSLGLLSTLEAVRQAYVPLTQDVKDSDDNFPRGIGLLEFVRGKTPFIFAITHFAISSQAQLRNAKEAIAAIDEFNEQDYPVIVAGDFNCAPEEAPVQLFISAGYVDEWARLQPKELATWPVQTSLVLDNYKQKHGRVPSWYIKPRRIDYILSKGIKAKSIEKIGKQVNGIWHSDHWGLVARY